MNYKKFVTYNILGGALWVISMSLIGYFFGNIPFIKRNFEYVIILVILLSIIPVVIGYFKHRKESKLTAEETV